MGNMVEADLPYWQVNVDEEERSLECPDYLRNLSDKDVAILKTPDHSYTHMSWSEVQGIIAANRIDLFQRVPSDLRRYREFTWTLQRRYGSVMDFVLTQRVQWPTPVIPKGRPFEFDEDVKILHNDWSYGIDERIVHLVVWTKFKLDVDPATGGDLTDQAREQIDAFVQGKLSAKVSRDSVNDLH